MSSADGDPFSTGAAEAARLVREVQDLGFEAARTIVERFVEVFAQFAGANGGAGPPRQGTNGGNGGGGGNRPMMGWWGSDWPMRDMPSDMQRAAEAYVGILGQLNEAGCRFLDASRAWEPPAAETDDLRLPDVAAGGRVSARLWLHNTTATAAADLRPWCPGLAKHTGTSLPGTTVTCTPESIDRLDPDASLEILVTMAVVEDTSPGTYHGLLLVQGLPDVAFPLHVRVLTPQDS